MFVRVPRSRERKGMRSVPVRDTGSSISPEFLASANAWLSSRPGKRRMRGAGMVNVAVALLFALAIGLYAVSLKAQFAYVMAVKHDDPMAWIEAIALDAGMAVFSLLALGLARAGQSARIERLFVTACALGSAAMNLAAADTTSARSVLAYVMPPLFLAGLVDRVVAVVRRHYLGDDAISAWARMGRACLAVLQFAGLTFLYVLRLVIAPKSTSAGVRLLILRAAPVPQQEPKPAPPRVITVRRPAIKPPRSKAITSNGESKTVRFLALVEDRHGPLSDFPIANVSRVCTELAPEVDLDPGAARTALRRAVLSVQNGSQS